MRYRWSLLHTVTVVQNVKQSGKWPGSSSVRVPSEADTRRPIGFVLLVILTLVPIFKPQTNLPETASNSLPSSQLNQYNPYRSWESTREQSQRRPPSTQTTNHRSPSLSPPTTILSTYSMVRIAQPAPSDPTTKFQKLLSPRAQAWPRQGV